MKKENLYTLPLDRLVTDWPENSVIKSNDIQTIRNYDLLDNKYPLPLNRLATHWPENSVININDMKSINNSNSKVSTLAILDDLPFYANK
jgi:hypothetical protein